MSLFEKIDTRSRRGDEAEVLAQLQARIRLLTSAATSIKHALKKNRGVADQSHD